MTRAIEELTDSNNEAAIGIAISTLNSNSSLLSIPGGYCLTSHDCVSGICGPVSTCLTNTTAVCPSTAANLPCSGHGVCQFFDSSGHPLNYCTANSPLCSTRCECEQGFYGAGCEIGEDEFRAQDDLRNTACSQLSNLTASSSSLTILAETYNPALTSPSTAQSCFIALKTLTASLPSTDSIGFSSWIVVISSLAEFVFKNSNATTIQAANVSNSLTNFSSIASEGLVPGQTATYATKALNMTVARKYSWELSNTTIAASDSSVTLPSTGLDACSLGSSIITYSIMQWNVNPYPNSSSIQTALLRWTKFGTTATPSPSPDQLFIELPFLSPQKIRTKHDSPSNYSFPTCQRIDSNNVGYIDCGCSVVSYSIYSTVFSCPVTVLCSAHGFGSQILSPTSTPTSNLISYQPVTTGTSSFEVTELGALLNSVVIEVSNILVSGYVNTQSPQGTVVVSLVSLWIVVLIAGLVFFRRWDVVDKNIILYGSPPHKKQRKSLAELVSLREAIDTAFMVRREVSEEQFMNEEHVDYQRRYFWYRIMRALSCICCMLCIETPKRRRWSVLVGGHIIPSLLWSLQAYHPYLWFFSNRSMQKTRVIRFISTFKAILLTMFISTIFFSIYYPIDSTCNVYLDATTCLSVPSKILSGHSECGWDEGNSVCFVEPPPKSAYFIISVSIMTTIIVAPFDLLFYLILNCVCSRRPEIEMIGLHSFDLLGSEGGAEVSSQLTAHGDLQNIEDEEGAISAVINSLRYFEQRHQRGLSTHDETQMMRALLRRLGLTLRDGEIALNYLSIIRFRNSIRSCVGHYVRRSRISALEILKNMQRYREDVDKGAYLAQMYTLEHFDFVTQISLKRMFLLFTAELPHSIHPVPWLMAWLFELGCILFFIIWILKWGGSTPLDTITSWSANFFLSIAQEILIVSVIRILAINVLVIEWARPTLRRIHGHLTALAEETEEIVYSNDSRIKLTLSPTLIASRHKSMDSVAVARLLRRTTDVREYYLRRVRMAKE